MTDKQLVGFIGVGVMGRPMATRLIEKGYKLVVNDTNGAATAAMEALGARAAGSARAVADEADIVFTSLPSPAIYRQVALGPDGVAQGRKAKVMVDLSTVGSSAAKEVAAGLLAKGIDLVDAPVSGGAAGAQKGTLAVMASGKAAAVAAARPLLEVFGKLFVVSEVPGQAQLMKVLNNMLSSTAVAITSEAYVAGLKGGLDPKTMMEVFNAGSGRNSATVDKFPKHVLPGGFDFGFPIASVCKDIGLAVDECQALGVPMWLGGQARQLWQSAYLQGGGPQDMTTLVKFVERWSKQ